MTLNRVERALGMMRKYLGTTPGAFRVSAGDGKRGPSHLGAPVAGNARCDAAMRSERPAFPATLAQAQ